MTQFHYSVRLSLLSDPSLVAFLKSRRGVDEGQERREKPGPPEPGTESQHGAKETVKDFSVGGSGMEESVRTEKDTRMEITGDKTRAWWHARPNSVARLSVF